ncbi:HAD hydrolase-like protein [Streptomyces sp. 3MP-14]|uniref:HAD hydrolase-like protein n=1 Tax=Streptomyces mimosae TaxID=2586635 RepID=A0A5N6AHK2_9ACTN|nr:MULTISPECIES: HAD family hydrolase [Streptomyces]KAB8167008.1 HAD hydrolase-like protein [Streptomyces mimosae]KAB8176949.1 HAD hydrolase-like protein [Streptomyces sp. 3MP-14]
MRGLVSNAHCVLFDFDGPVCQLFAVRSAESVAVRLRSLTEELAVSALLTAELRTSKDPHRVLREIARRRPEPAVLSRLEAALTAEEVSAAASARPTPYAGTLIAALAGRGRRVAIATNNSPLAAARYLERQRLAGYVAGRVYGRTADLDLLKPHPDSVLRALAGTGADPARSLMIGDSLADHAAATAAGVPFLGYALDDAGEHALRAAGAECVVRSLQWVLAALGHHDGHEDAPF